MVSLASEATGGEHHQRLDIIQSITDFWSHRKKCMVLDVLESDSVESLSDNEHEQTDVHVVSLFSIYELDCPSGIFRPSFSEDIEDINDDLNVTDNKENDSYNIQIFQNSRELVWQEKERDTAQQEQDLLDSKCCGSRISHILLPSNIKKRGSPIVHHFIRKVPKKLDSLY